ncbi:ABC transporter substrate-binding protein [Microbacterium sp. C7(2022)]|uniref:ABC transporter substrate-binding protein n=1 Tax=Microbacterium sp. C7(2022) TaxID=2992759 RepID=UPI00237BF9E6|nr:ABC transporter substrate-binding protein [Microbacterium sp. C7(2022)]MDE0545418.1 ABC transporter substrate-binding protein [Microbacterium sp. C7(2022)]
MKRPLIIVGTLAVGALALAGCSGSGDTGSSEGGEATYVDGATFTMAVSADGGLLDPQMNAGSVTNQMTQFAYDSLVAADPADGSIVSQLATEWTVDTTELTFTLADGITCADGSDFTADTVVRNIEYVGDPANESPLLGAFLPVGATATAEGNVVTVTLAAPASFAINAFASLPMVCDAGMDDRSTLASATNGTGPYVLTEAVPNDHYTYEVREDYTWGPDGATTAETGVPASVVVRVVENETTAANLLLSGEVNAGGTGGADAQRLIDAGLFYTETESLGGQQWHNQGEGHVTADPAVRLALTQAIDYSEMMDVVGMGQGAPPTSFAALAPAACVGDSVTAAMPAYDTEAAAALLDEAGWVMGSDGVREKDGTPLEIKFRYETSMGQGGTAGAELATSQWEALGVKVDLQTQDETVIQDTIFNTGDWDVVWITLNVSSPDQIITFVSGESVTNFGHIANEEYEAAIAEAATVPGADGCDAWLAAESALVASADVFPYMNSLGRTFGNGAEFEVGGDLEPLSVRMLG